MADTTDRRILIIKEPEYAWEFTFRVRVASYEDDTHWTPLDDILGSAASADWSSSSRSADSWGAGGTRRAAITWSCVKHYNFASVLMEAARKYYAATGEHDFFLCAHALKGDKPTRSMRCAMHVYPLSEEILAQAPVCWEQGGPELALGSVMKVINKADQPLTKEYKDTIFRTLRHAAALKDQAFFSLARSIGCRHAIRVLFPSPYHIGAFLLFKVPDKYRHVALFDEATSRVICLTGKELSDRLEAGDGPDELFDDGESIAKGQDSEADIDLERSDTSSAQYAKLWKERGDGSLESISFGDQSSMASHEARDVFGEEEEEEDDDGNNSMVSHSSSSSALLSWENESFSEDSREDSGRAASVQSEIVLLEEEDDEM